MKIENEYFTLEIIENQAFLCAHQIGYPLKSFDEILQKNPRLKIQSFTALRNAFIELHTEHLIGYWLPLVEVTVAQNKMSAEVIFHVTAEEAEENREQLVREMEELLNKIEVIYGRIDFEQEFILPGVPMLCAVGREPQKGADAKVLYIEKPKKQPVIREDGSADHYEMNFVYHISEGDWLGEKIVAKDGQDGMDVYGNILPALKGNDVKLTYDNQSVYEEVPDEEVIYLKASHGGALEFTNGKVSVGKHLTISGDVGVETGSITFDGSVTVSGTVQAGYSVKASGDISIEGLEGVTNAKLIQSTAGDIYIKGGIFGGDETIVEAHGKIFVKHANNCKLYATEIHVGLYLVGTYASANEVHVDRLRGKIIGGKIEAITSIMTAFSGNNHERPTHLSVQGVDKNQTYQAAQDLAKQLKEHQTNVARIREHTAKLEPIVQNLSSAQLEAYEKSLELIKRTELEIQEIEREIQLHLQRIKTAKEGTVEVAQMAYAGTVIQIGKQQTQLQQDSQGIFKLENGVLNV